MLKHHKPARVFLLGLLAAVAWFGVLLQFALSLALSKANGYSLAHGAITYFGYFTVLSNLLVAVIASMGLVVPESRAFSGSVRGCATTAIVLVGIGYHVLLREVWDPQGWQQVADNTLHYVVPLLSLAYWGLFPPRWRLADYAPLAWGAYPVAYFAYVIVRGELIGSYPYYFIDVGELGFATVLTNALAFLLAFVALGFGIRALARLRWSEVVPTPTARR